MTADVQRELAEARQMLLVHDALYNLIVDHPMWIDGKGRGLHYSPKREALIGDFLDSAVEVLAPVIADAEKRAAAAAYEQGQEDLRHTLDLLHARARAAALDPAGAASGETT